MTRIVEISGVIHEHMWNYNALHIEDVTFPPVSVTPCASIPKHGFEAHTLTFSTLTGTYTETAAHMIEGAPTIDQIPPAELIRPARLMRIPIDGPRSLIRLDDLERHDPGLEDGEALIIDTGWGARWDEPRYVLDAPAFASSTLSWFLKQPLSILALDTPVMECFWCNDEGLTDERANLLGPLYERGLILVAPVVNLDQITTPRGTLVSLPLAVQGVCSTPCRALYVEDATWADPISTPVSP